MNRPTWLGMEANPSPDPPKDPDNVSRLQGEYIGDRWGELFDWVENRMCKNTDNIEYLRGVLHKNGWCAN